MGSGSLITDFLDSQQSKVELMKSDGNTETIRERILVVEDEEVMRRAISDCLKRRGYRVMIARDGAEGMEKVQREKPDLIVLDVMMPILDGWSFCAALRKWEIKIPVLFLSAKGTSEDRVRGLDLGGDDYLVKPFSRDELLARIRALLRRAGQPGAGVGLRSTWIEMGHVKVNLALMQATRQDRPLALTPKEFGALELMSQRFGEVVSRETFLDRVWGVGAFPTTRTVDRHIASLRQKIETDPADPQFILTVHGVGYRFSEKVKMK